MKQQAISSASPMSSAFTLALVLAAASLISSCGPHRKAWVHPGYEEEDKSATLRLGVLTSPQPAGDPDVGRLWSMLARRYANQHRDFIVRDLPGTDSADPLSHCAPGLEGILHLLPLRVEEKGRGWALSTSARIVRCRDGETIWEVRARGRFPSDDQQLHEVRRRYEDALGEGIGPLVAPSFRLMRAALSTLPRPKLITDADVMEKIELGE